MWEKHFNTITSALQEGLIITDDLLHVQFVNGRATQLLEIEVADIMNKPLTLIDRAFNYGLKCMTELKVMRDIQCKYHTGLLVITFTPLLDESRKRAVGLSITLNDLVTHQGLKARVDSEALMLDAFDVLLNSTNEWYVIVDANGIITAMSKAYKEFVGDNHPEGKHVAQVIENTRMHQVLSSGEAEYNELQIIRGNKMIASRIPILHDNLVVGAIGKAQFKDIDDLYTLYNKVQKNQRKISVLVEPQEGSTARYTFDNITGSSLLTKQAINLAKKASKTDSNVLIVGPSGTGKELFAHAIHNASSRNRAPFVMVNCAAIPSELLESELFGYEQGAFTGANRHGKKGRFEQAQKGTIFLDEIGDMPLDMQAKLLRVLQSKEIDRVGGDIPINIDVRVIAATNQALEQMVDKRNFRQDLYYRLNVMRLNLSALNLRKEEIPELADDILRKLANRMGLVVHGFTDNAMTALCAYDWPGNIRELENALERALNLMEDDLYIHSALLPEHLNAQSENAIETLQTSEKLNELTDKIQKEWIERALKETNGNKKRAAELLGLSRSGLYKKLKAFNL